MDISQVSKGYRLSWNTIANQWVGLHPIKTIPHDHYDRTQTDNSTINKSTDNFPISKAHCTQEQLRYPIDYCLFSKDHDLGNQYRPQMGIYTFSRGYAFYKYNYWTIVIHVASRCYCACGLLSHTDRHISAQQRSPSISKWSRQPEHD